MLPDQRKSIAVKLTYCVERSAIVMGLFKSNPKISMDEKRKATPIVADVNASLP